MEGTITYTEFKDQCNALLEQSILLQDHWQKRISKDGRLEYIVKKCTRAYSVGNIEVEDFDEIQLEDTNDCNDCPDACEKTANFQEEETVLFEYQVIYSESYSVPVLYFFASKSNGKSLLLEEVWQQVPPSYKNALDDKWSFITQTEHPLLGCPVYFIHPCHTSTMMSNLTTAAHIHTSRKMNKYLLSWLSATGPVVGLKMPMEYFQ